MPENKLPSKERVLQAFALGDFLYLLNFLFSTPTDRKEWDDLSDAMFDSFDDVWDAGFSMLHNNDGTRLIINSKLAAED